MERGWMFEWLRDPVWQGIGTIVTISTLVSPIAYRRWRKFSQASKTKAFVNRFVAIYKAHGIERIQIPRFLGEESGLTVAHLVDDEKLLHALSEKVLNETCTRFGVMRNWLDGKPCVIYPERWYDEDFKGFIDFLEGLQDEHDCVEVFVIKCQDDELQSGGPELPVAFVFRGRLKQWGETGDESIWRYYPLYSTWSWNYDWNNERMRIQFKAMILSIWQFDLYPCGVELPKQEIESLAEGIAFPETLIGNALSWAAWHPVDYIFADGESYQVKDGKEAFAVRKEMERLGWMDYLIKKTGPLRIPLAC